MLQGPGCYAVLTMAETHYLTVWSPSFTLNAYNFNSLFMCTITRDIIYVIVLQ